jgi:hypothetical protein
MHTPLPHLLSRLGLMSKRRIARTSIQIRIKRRSIVIEDEVPNPVEAKYNMAVNVPL